MAQMNDVNIALGIEGATMGERTLQLFACLFVAYIFCLVGWQVIETRRLLSLGDWTGDSYVTISDTFNAWLFAWETPARALLNSAGPKAIQFLQLEAPPQPLMIALSLVLWTAIAFVPTIIVGVALGWIDQALDKKRGF